MKAFIKGTGSYVPKKVLSNADLEKMVETTDEWIVSRTGINERRIAAKMNTHLIWVLKQQKMLLKMLKLTLKK